MTGGPQADWPTGLRRLVGRLAYRLDTTVVSEARPSGAGAEDEEDEVVGEMGEGEDEDNDEVEDEDEDLRVVRVLP